MQEGYEAAVHPHLPNNTRLRFSRDTRSWSWMRPAHESSCAWSVHGTTRPAGPGGAALDAGDMCKEFLDQGSFVQGITQYRLEGMVSV